MLIPQCSTTGDKDKVWRDLGIQMRGIVELTSFARAVDNERWSAHKGMISLARLTDAYVGSNLPKDKNVVLGRWDATLTEDMIEC